MPVGIVDDKITSLSIQVNLCSCLTVKYMYITYHTIHTISQI